MSASRPLDPHPELWAALEHGRRLRVILEDFYEQVYADPRLAPFFARTTKSWAIDHQYAFLGEILSGTDMFFGDRPRNAHHWMVIDDALFDYREELMMKTLERHGLTAEQRAEWRAIEEVFRSHIVKSEPRPLVRAGKTLPLEGYDAIALSSGGLCDFCSSVIAIGAIARYHVRTGHVYCDACFERKNSD